MEPQAPSMDKGLAGRLRVHPHAIHAHRFVDVLDPPFTQGLVSHVELLLDLVICSAGDHDTPRLGQLLQSVRYVDAVAMYVVALDDDIAEVDADAEYHSAIGWQGSVAPCFGALHVDRTTKSVDDAVELDQ